jgi:PEP-CTERM motif
MQNVTQALSSRAPHRSVSKLQSRLTGLVLAALAGVSMLATAKATVIEADAITISDGQVLVADDLVAGQGFPPITWGLVLETSTLSIAPTGILDLQDNALIVRETPFNTVYGYVVTGYDGGTWTGYGVQSSTAASDPTHLTALGIVNNAEAHYTTFAGRDLTLGTETLVAYTYYGDANLDGIVTLEDFALIGTGSGWYHGDFNYSGAVDAADYDLFYANFPGQIPEPGSLALMAAGVAGLLLRRRARRSAS